MKTKNVLIIAMIAMIGIVSNVGIALPQYLNAYIINLDINYSIS
jgi:hypothetical protein